MVLSFHAVVGEKDRTIQKLGGGDIPAPSKWSPLPGQAMAGERSPEQLKGEES